MFGKNIFGTQKKENRKNIVFIYGMGKSGTSLVAQLIQDIVGFNDQDLMEGRMDNVFGYYENMHMVDINNQILERLKIRFPVQEEIKGNLKFNFPDLEKKAEELVKNLLKENHTVVFKDPRLAITLPFWTKITKRFNQHLIFVFRHPMEVAMSLSKAAKFDVNTSLLSWEINNRICLDKLKRQETLMLSYDDLMNSTEREILRIYKFLKIKTDADILAKQIFLALPEIRHYVLKQEDMHNLSRSISSIYQEILKLSEKDQKKHAFEQNEKAAKLSAEEKIIILRDRLSKLDKLVRKQFDEMQELGTEYLRMERSNRFLSEENKKLFKELDSKKD